MPLVVSVLFAQHDVDSPNVASRMDTIQSLVERRTFCIDQSLGKFRVDVIKIGDHFYSDKPPLLSVLGAGLYWPLHTILGMSFANKAHEPWLYHILTVVFVGLTAAIGLWLLAQCLFLAGLESSAIARTVILTGAGTMFLPYAVTFNNHVPAAMAITGALYCFLRAQSNGASAARWLALAGLFAGLAFNLDVVPGAVALVGFAALAFQRKRRLADVAAYGIGLIGPMLVFFFLNWL
ncbi:glycosyltransferase family 39 protein, partial [Candidatus Sumerlaeota bacterium]|nr:glycosyltransferase family 39 protein [Candidatus Sumerlaeota bacterium]